MPTPKISWTQRSDLPHILNERGLLGIGVEVGVQTGYNAEQIRSAWKGELLIGVDPWLKYGTDVSQDMHDEYAQLAMKRLNATRKNFALIRATSLEGAKIVGAMGKKLDFVYLDASHDYQDVLDDIDAWRPLIREGGILCGHDYLEQDGWRRHGDPVTAYESSQGPECGPGPFFVKKAVLDRFSLEDVSITSPQCDMGWMSWAVVLP